MGLLDGLLPHAMQRYAVSRHHQLEAWRAGDGYRLRENGREDEPHANARSAAEGVCQRIQQLALEALPQFTKIHAGCANWDGKRLLAAGPAQSGKTTLMTRLLYEGFAVHCDDIVLLQGDKVLPYPERFSIRPATVALIPQIAALAARIDGGSSARLTLDPSELGFEWRIDSAPVDAIFFLERTDGGATRLERCPKYAMAERVMAQSSPPAGGARDWVRDMCAMLDRAACYVLRSHDLEGSILAVKEGLRGGVGAGATPVAPSSAGGSQWQTRS